MASTEQARQALADKFTEYLRAMLGERVTLPQRSWLRFGQLSVYVRVGFRIIDGDRIKCVQLANLSAPRRSQGLGHYTRLIAAIRKETDIPIFVECVINPRFLAALLRRGYEPVNGPALLGGDVVLMGEEVTSKKENKNGN